MTATIAGTTVGSGFSRIHHALTRLSRWMVAPANAVLPPREAYALWAETYPPRPHNALMQVEQMVMARVLTAISPRRAIDVGTGTGRNVPLLAAAGARTIVGVDLSMAMLTRGLPAAPRVCGDALHLPFADRSFDLVCSSLMIGDLPDLTAWSAEAARLLKRGGHVVYSDFHPSWSAQRWRRTFRAADGREFAVAYVPHTLEQHLDALDRAGLEVRTVREPRVAGRSTPIVIVIHSVKR